MKETWKHSLFQYKVKAFAVNVAAIT